MLGRTVKIMLLGVMLLALTAGVAVAALEVGNDRENRLVGTAGDEQGQDTLFGLGDDDELIGRSAADQLAGGDGDDTLKGGGGNDTLDGGSGNDIIFMSKGFDFVYAADGERDDIDCNGEEGYRIEFDEGLDDLDNCPDSGASAASTEQQSAADAEGTTPDDGTGSTRKVVVSQG